MPIPGFSLIARPETISAAQAVEMVMERFKSSACTEAEACAWLAEQVHQRKLKLCWTDTDPECLGGLHLTGEGLFPIPRFLPGARTIDEVDWGAGLAIDELDWCAGELRRRVRYPNLVDGKAGDVDLLKLTHSEPLARFGFCATDSSHEREPKDRVIEELRYRFTIKRASLVAILDRVSVPLGTMPVRLSKAAGIVASHFNVSGQMGLDAIVDAAAAERIEVYGKPPSRLLGQGDRIGSWVWRQVARDEAVLSPDAAALSTHTLAGEPATWSDPYVFRADLERLVR